MKVIKYREYIRQIIRCRIIVKNLSTVIDGYINETIGRLSHPIFYEDP